MENQQEESRKKFVEECGRRFEKLLSGTREQIQKGRDRIEILQQEIVKLVRETQGAERKLEQIEATRPTQLEAYSSEYDNLLRVDGVIDVQVAGGVIKVFTNQININHDGITYLIGKFRIEIYTSGANDGVRFFNLSNGGSGPAVHNSGLPYNRHHPHVKGDGVACLGNISTSISQLIGEYQYSVVAILAIQFLRSVNVEDSAGKGIFLWPKEGEDE